MELTARQATILELIVREYADLAAPVSSKVLVERYDLGVSSATVRNDMAILEEYGLIYAPHTSAGRVPTEEGYRTFVQQLLSAEQAELPAGERRSINSRFSQTGVDFEQWLRQAAAILASTVRTASIVTSPAAQEPRLKHVELIHTQGRMVLMVVVLEGGAVRQQMLCLSEPVQQAQLSDAAALINRSFRGRDAGAVRVGAQVESTLTREIAGLVADLLERAGHSQRRVFTDGLVNVLDPHYLADNLPGGAQPSEEVARVLHEADTIGARQTLHLLEEHSMLEEVLADALAAETSEVRVLIGGDGRWEALSHTTVILSRYGHGSASGALGVLGPTRLRYGHAISAVRYVAGLMTDHVIDVYGSEDPLG